MVSRESPKERFDRYAENYRDLHQASVASSGEEVDYFAGYKLECLKRRGISLSAPVLDYGCGIGNLTEKLVGDFREVHGYDPSPRSLEVAQKRAASAILHSELAAVPDAYFETAVLACVLHHVPPAERNAVLQTVRTKLRPGGKLVVFEHNPLNPLTRRAVAACPFDDDAVLLWPWEARRELKDAGFLAVELDYIVFFPHALRALQRFEPLLARLPIGAQTMLVASVAA
jgi:SAM-dependent methyltransferase